MTARRFVDTNVLLYSVSTIRADEQKAEIAREVLTSDDLCFSVQVLQEFYEQATRKSRGPMLLHHEALALARKVCEFPVQALTVELFHAAAVTKHRFGISYWDAGIVEAARALGSTVVLSEDLSDQQDYDGIRVINPFRS